MSKANSVISPSSTLLLPILLLPLLPTPPLPILPGYGADQHYSRALRQYGRPSNCNGMVASKRHKCFVGLRYFDHVIGHGFYFGIAFSNDGNHMPAAGFYFLYIADHLFVR